MKAITKLKDILFIQLIVLSLFAYQIYAQNPVSGTVRFQDNNEVVKQGTVKAYDQSGTLLAVTNINTDGTYIFESLGPVETDLLGFPNLEPEEEDNFVPTYHPSAVMHSNAVTVYPSQALAGIDIYVERITSGDNCFKTSISGIITLNNKPVNDAIIHAKSGDKIIGYGITAEDGVFKVKDIPAGDYILVIHRLNSSVININVTVTTEGIKNLNVNLEKALPKTGVIDGFKLSQNYPNPFNPSTLISYSIKKSDNVKITVYNSAGQMVKELVNGFMTSGSYNVVFDGSNLSSGIYYYKMVTGSYTETRKMILVK